MRHRFYSCTGFALAIAMMAVFMGCGADEPVASNAATGAVVTAAVPTFSEIQTAVKLDDADAIVVKNALAQWQKSAAGASARGPAERPRAAMTFVAAVAPSLDDAQLGQLVDLLVDRREAHMKATRASFDGRGHRGKHFADKLATQLDLSADQRKAMKALHEETRTKARALHEQLRSGSITEDQMETGMQALHDAQREKLSGILSAEQLGKLDALRDERQGNRLARRIERADARSDAHAQWLAEALALNEAQKARVQAALDSFAAKQKAALESVRGGDAAGHGARAQMRAEREARAKALEDILTDEQSARLEILRRLHPHGPHDL